MQSCHSMLCVNINYFRSKPMNIPKRSAPVRPWLSPWLFNTVTRAGVSWSAFKLHRLRAKPLIIRESSRKDEWRLAYPQIMKKIKFELSTKPSKQEKAAQGKTGFVPAIARWVVERSNAWTTRCKILVKNHDRTLTNATPKLNQSFVRLLVKRLAAF